MKYLKTFLRVHPWTDLDLLSAVVSLALHHLPLSVFCCGTYYLILLGCSPIVDTTISENLFIDAQQIIKNSKNLLEVRSVLNIVFPDQLLVLWHLELLEKSPSLHKILLLVLLEMHFLEKEDGSVHLQKVIEIAKHIDVVVVLGVPNVVVFYLFWLQVVFNVPSNYFHFVNRRGC